MSIGADGAEYCVKYWSIGAGVSIEYRFHTNPASGEPPSVVSGARARASSDRPLGPRGSFFLFFAVGGVPLLSSRVGGDGVL